MTIGKTILTVLLVAGVYTSANPASAADNTAPNRGVTAGELGADQLLPALSESDIAIIRNIVRVEMTNKEPGTVVPWENSESGNSGLIILRGTPAIEDMACREVTYVLSMAGEDDSQAYFLTSCLRPDGIWMNVF